MVIIGESVLVTRDRMGHEESRDAGEDTVVIDKNSWKYANHGLEKEEKLKESTEYCTCGKLDTAKASNFAPHGNVGPFLARSLASLGELFP